MSEIDQERTQTISENLNLIMEIADLTIDGLAEYVGISRSTVNRALLMVSNLSPSITLKIANAFELKSKDLTDRKLSKIKSIQKIEKLLNFKSNNQTNFHFFTSEVEKHNAQLFVKKELLKDDYFLKERKKKSMIERLKQSENFQEEFTKAALEQSIKRILSDEIFLKVARKSPNGKVFYYVVENLDK